MSEKAPPFFRDLAQVARTASRDLAKSRKKGGGGYSALRALRFGFAFSNLVRLEYEGGGVTFDFGIFVT